MRPLGGEPLLLHTLRALDGSGLLDGGVVSAPPELCSRVESLLSDAGLSPRWRVTSGGDTRQESVGRALAELGAEFDVVLVHDAARPFVPASVLQRVLTAVRAGADAVVPVVPVADTVKAVSGDAVLSTPDRDSLRQVQTPQGFHRSVLESAYRALTSGAQGTAGPATDDAGLVERLGGRVVVVEGDPLAFKVTGPLDLLLAEALLRGRR